jgi:tight adherence protein B
MMRRFLTLNVFVAGFMLATIGPATAQDSSGASTTDVLLIVGAAAAGIALFLLIMIVFGPNKAVERDLSGRLGTYAPQTETKGKFKNPFLRRFASKAESVAERRGMTGMIETALEQANMPISPGEAIAGALGLSIVVGLLAGVLSRNIIWALVFAGATLLIAAVAVQTVARRERVKFENQLPDTLNLISTSLRAGYSLLQALEAVASESPEPTGREFGRAINETRLGRSPVDSLKDVAERMQSVDFDWAVLAISIQREVGGNLAEVLQTAAETMLHRNRLRREMKALTAEGRISAIVLSALPILLFAFLYMSNPTYLEPLFSTIYGIIALVVAGILMVAGIVWLNKIVTIEV